MKGQGVILRAIDGQGKWVPGGGDLRDLRLGRCGGGKRATGRGSELVWGSGSQRCSRQTRQVAEGAGLQGFWIPRSRRGMTRSVVRILRPFTSAVSPPLIAASAV
jgi:hypothetical protein